MKNLIYLVLVLSSLTAYGQIIQNVNKTSGTVPKPITQIDSIRFNAVTNQMEIIQTNGNAENHVISDIINVTFSGQLNGTLTTIDCAGGTTTGTLTSGTAANGVSTAISYTGGNAGTYSAQNVASTGVTGLTATLAAGTLANGNGSVTYTITGTPASVGTATFAITLGGQSCSFIINVSAPAAALTTINCASATTTGTLTSGTAANGVSTAISYTGGNAGTYGAQSVASTGVTGLTASLAAGTLANGNGSVTYTITGTPASSGTASFAITLGGQSCSFTVNVSAPAAALSTINCASATTTGTLTSGTAANGVSTAISYTGGNAGTYSAQNVTSTGVTGLIASLVADTLANGNGTITYTITGTPASSGTASFAITLGGQSCSFTVNVSAPAAALTTIDCASATTTGTLMSGTAANGVSTTITYTGGNAGTYSAQNVASTGVTGLTASLVADTLANGNGSVTYTITGTPASVGTASFAITLGGQSCSFTVNVSAPSAALTTIDCAGATTTGTLTSGTAANGVSTTITYTGGNAGTYSAQNVASTGVTGLTASLVADTLANGNGSITYTITGTPASSGTASFPITLGGQSCSFTINVAQPPYPANSVFCAAGITTVLNVTNPITGRIWMDRNLGASQVAISSTDQNAYGDLYQWGRRSDGHQCRTSSTIVTLSSLDQPAHGNFILSTNAQLDWRSPQNTNLWQGVNGVNNPCPSGYRIPTETEMDNERLSWSQNNIVGASASPLKWTLAGFRDASSGMLWDVGSTGIYWSSTVSTTFSSIIGFDTSMASIYFDARASGNSVRCIQEIAGVIGALNCNGAIHIGIPISGQAASNVSASVPYTGGNGGFYAAQNVASTGVTGLTAAIVAGNLANGNGAITYTITGTPASSGTASFAISLGGQSCSFTISVGAIGQYPVGTVNCAGSTLVVDVTNPATGLTWMDRNLGASQVATSSTDQNAYGDLYQWGRRADGHQCRTSPTTATLSSVNQPVHGNFIIINSGNYDWRSPQNTNLWQGVNGVNNPCPSGYRLPTETELNNECLSWGSNNGSGAFAAPLKWTLAGYRNNSNGSLSSVGTSGYYWSSTVSGTFSRGLLFLSSGANMGNGYRARGFTVRCVKETVGAVGAISCNGVTTSGNLISGSVASNVSASLPYTGGNGGYYAVQTTASTGVTGLTASLTQGLLANGNGSVTYTITGTPASAGTASFAISLGGQSCSFTMNVSAPAVLSTINCAGATTTGTLTIGTAANGVSTAISYTGGNAGTYSAQNVASTGVTGLTATLAAGTLANGNGSVTYTITGTPASAGTASFAISLGGQSCIFTVNVSVPAAALGSLDCAGATTTGTLYSGTSANGVSTAISYYGGNAGMYSAQSVSSTGVTGLIATLAAGTLTNGSGSVTYIITGTPASAGTANFAITLGGQSCSFTVSVGVAIGQYPAGTVHCAGSTAVVDVTNPTTGLTWMDRNLGASQVATFSSDQNAYGDLYQWGRRADGHQCRTSPTTAPLSSVDQPAHGNFITSNGGNYDWRSPQNINLWQGVNGVNNPCPSGYRIPTETELTNEYLSWGNSTYLGAFASPLKWTLAGNRYNSNGSLLNGGTDGFYWSSTVAGTYSRCLHFNSSPAQMANLYRASGLAVRCVKN